MKRLLSSMVLGILLCTATYSSSAQTPQQIAEGAKVWSANCTRCHNGRSSMERTDREWTTIVLHMRARANLTRGEASSVITYMQATNAPETAAISGETATLADENLTVADEQGEKLERRMVSTIHIRDIETISQIHLLAVKRILADYK